MNKWCVLLFSFSTLLYVHSSQAQDLEPRHYINIPIDQNFIATSYFHSEGEVSASPSVPLDDASITIDGSVFGYARTFNLAGNLAKFDINSSYACSEGNALLNGDRVQGKRCGGGDTKARFSYNFYGAPAIEAQDFRQHQRGLVIGSSIQVSAPTGQYDGDKVLNIGANRWYIRPEIGVSFPINNWSVEVALGAKIFTDNDDHFGKTLQQDPLYNTQLHLVYDINPRQWVAFNANYFWGGATEKDGIENQGFQKNSRLGVTYSHVLGRSLLGKAFYHKGVVTRIGNDSDTAGLALMYRF